MGEEKSFVVHASRGHVVTKIGTAVEDAAEAKESAATAKSDAEAAKADAAEAVSDAAEAKAKAEAAAIQAATADAKADAAEEKSDAAKTSATNAQNVAQTARQIALKALNTAQGATDADGNLYVPKREKVDGVTHYARQILEWDAGMEAWGATWEGDYVKGADGAFAATEAADGAAADRTLTEGEA
jgi:hypothetical protein